MSTGNVETKLALTDFTEITGKGVIYESALTAGRETDCTIVDAPVRILLDCILEGTDLHYRRLPSGGFIIERPASPGATYRDSQKSQRGRIRGHVVDAENGDPLVHVNVFLDETTMGSSTDEEGHFIIEHVPPGSYDVVASMVGYTLERLTVEVREDTDQQYVHFRLQPAVFVMDEIVLTDDHPTEWRRDLKRFEALFLGSSANARDTHILNPYVLEFTESEGVFSAEASEPLLIENRALGYRITFVLTDFRMDDAHDLLFVNGPSHFAELEPSSSTEAAQWSKRRIQTFRGSLQHVLSSIVRGGAQTHDLTFKLDNRTDAPFSRDQPVLRSVERADILREAREPHLYELSFAHYLMVTYRGERSWIKMNRPAAIVHEMGYVRGGATNPGALTVYGSISKRRIADLLPRDYAHAL